MGFRFKFHAVPTNALAVINKIVLETKYYVIKGLHHFEIFDAQLKESSPDYLGRFLSSTNESKMKKKS